MQQLGGFIWSDPPPPPPTLFSASHLQFDSARRKSCVNIYGPLSCRKQKLSAFFGCGLARTDKVAILVLHTQLSAHRKTTFMISHTLGERSRPADILKPV